MHQRSLAVLGLLLGLALLASATQAANQPNANPFVIDPAAEKIELTPIIRYLQDPSSTLVINDILSDDSKSLWRSAGQNKQILNFGYTNATYWFSAKLTNPNPAAIERILEIAYPVLDFIDVYWVSPGRTVETWHLGDKRPFSNRPIGHRHFLIPLTIPPQNTVELYLKVKTSSSMQVPLVLWQQNALLEEAQLELLGLGIYYGTMMVMVLYNLFVYFSVKEANYLYYVFYVACMTAFIASLNGITHQYLWPESTWWNDQSIIVNLFGVLLFGALFTRNFLKLPKHKPFLSKLFSLFAIFAACCIGLSFILPYAVMIIIVISISVLAIAVAIGTSMIRWSEGDTTAKYYTIAWFTLLMGGVILAFNKFNLLPRNFFTENATQIGSAVEVILLSFALADRLNVEKRKRYLAQQQSLEHERISRVAQAEALEQEKQARKAQEEALEHERAAREAQVHALEIQRRANETLEQRVKERTEDLEIANQKLEQLTFTDGLTGIKNRRYFDRAMDKEYRRAFREKWALGLLIIDIDHFKQFNDQFGHLIGDDCLRTVAQEIENHIYRDTDIAARFGGEEFCVLLPNTDNEGTQYIAEKLRQAIEDLKFKADGDFVPIHVSIGATSYTPRQEHGYELMISIADEALYRSKQQGRNRVTFQALDTTQTKGSERGA